MSPLHEATWRGYVAWNLPNRRVFRLLRDEYRRAVDRIPPTITTSRFDDPNRQLSKHLMIVFWHGEIEAEEKGCLFDQFFSKAPDVLRAEAIHHLARILRSENEVPEVVIDRLKRLWSLRHKAVRVDRDQHIQERQAFIYWFVSNKFDDAWSLNQLNVILELSDKVEHEERIMEWLAEIAPHFPDESLDAFRILAERLAWGYQISQWSEHVMSILDTSLQASQPKTRQAATDLIHHLGSRGHYEFRILLQKGDSASD